MSLYIHKENQEILWRLINKLPYIIKNSELSKHKESIFKEIVGKFYEQNKMIQLSLAELEQLNKDTLILFNEQIVKLVSVPNPINNIISNVVPVSVSTEYIPYKDKPAMQNMFNEKIGDEPISNMEELIEIYKKQRFADEPITNLIKPN